PVAIDNDFAVWRAFHNQYWPALYIVDAQGRIRHYQFGEGGYEESERVIQKLLDEAGHGSADTSLTSVKGQGPEAPADWGSLASPETYLGTAHAESFASPGGAVRNERHVYAFPERLKRNEWALSGDWTMRDEPIKVNAAGGHIKVRFHARDVHLVMGPGARGATVRFKVLLDRRPPGAHPGGGVHEQGNGLLRHPR